MCTSEMRRKSERVWVLLKETFTFSDISTGWGLPITCGLTLRICGTTDDVGELGLQACVGCAILTHRLISPGAQRQHTLQRRVGPQTLTLVDGQRRGVVNKQSSILKEAKK